VTGWREKGSAALPTIYPTGKEIVKPNNMKKKNPPKINFPNLKAQFTVDNEIIYMLLG
jgi:hypothetical protein